MLNTAIILAAGQSLRLRPLTNDRPKCLLKIGHRTIIDFQIETLKTLGIYQVIVVTGYQAEMLENYLLAEHPEIKFNFIRNPDFSTTSAAHSLWIAKEHLIGPILYLNSDALCEPAIIEKVINHPSDSATAIQKTPWDEEEVNVTIDGASKIIAIGKDIPPERSNGEFIGVTKFGKKFTEALIGTLNNWANQGETNHYAVDAINATLQEPHLTFEAVDVSEHIAIEIDTPEDYLRARRLWEEFMSKI